MTNNWNIPDWLEKKIKERDKKCVYCGKKFTDNIKDKAEWEHIDNNGNNICEGNIALCCGSCNRSKGNKKLLVWLESDYCKRNNIKNKATDIIKRNIGQRG